MIAKIRFFSLCCLIFIPILLLAQRRPVAETPTVNNFPTNSKVDTLGRDSLKVSIDKTINISKDALDEPVDYEAKDSIVFDNKNNLIHLYGNASVKYTTIEVRAAYILLNVKESITTAESRKDSSGRVIGIPNFKDKEQTFKAGKMRYNFKSRKGIIYDVQTKQENLYVLGEKTKYVSAKDSTENDVIYSKDAILTTCSDPHPHFGIRAKKMKVIAGKMVIVGASNLEFGGVPTPIWLPFGFYPVTKQKQTGLIFPTFARTGPDGLGLQGLGWYFPINQYIDLTAKTDIYFSSGRYALYLGSNYKKRYKFNGNFSLRIDNIAQKKPGLPTTYSRPISIDWSHRQDPTAHPNQNFSASVGVSTNAAVLQRNTLNDVRNVSSNINRSSINYSRKFPSKPFSFNSGVSINQNVQSHTLNIDPTIDFSINTLYPFKKFKREGKDDALNTIIEQFNVRPSARARASINTFDTLLFDKSTFENRLRAGMQYGLEASAPFRLFKVFTVSPNATFNQDVNFDVVKKELLQRTKMDSIASVKSDGKIVKEWQKVVNDTIIDRKIWKATPISTFRMGVQANTSMFGTKQFRKGYFRGVRHKMDLSLGFTYEPVLTKSSWYDSVGSVRRTLNDVVTKRQYSIFENAAYNTASSTFDPKNIGKGRKIISINSTHNVEIKVKGKRDTVPVKKTILRSLEIGVDIDLNADTQRVKPNFATSINQNLFGGLVSIQFKPEFIAFVPRLRPNSTTEWMNSNEYLIKNEKIWGFIPKPVKFDGGSFNVSSRISVADIRKMMDKRKQKPIQDTAISLRKRGEILSNDSLTINKNSKDNGLKQPIAEKRNDFKDITHLIDNFSLSHTYNFSITKNTFDRRDSLVTGINTLSLSGSIPLSSHWNITFTGLGYDFNTKKPPYAGVGISRNLHCWQVSGSWYPTRGTFLFTLKVIDSPLGDFLKYPVQKQTGDAYGGGYRF